MPTSHPTKTYRVRLALPPLNEEDAVVARALEWLVQNREQQPSLETLARALELRPFSLQKRFSRWAGVSPKTFLALVTANAARERLQHGDSLLQTTYDLGLSAPSRLHDLFVRIEAMTPGEYKNRGEGVSLAFGCHPTPFGLGFFAASPRGLCALGFRGSRFPDKQSAKNDFQRRWPRARLYEEDAKQDSRTAFYAHAIFPAQPPTKPETLTLHAIASPFRLHVWLALLQTPPGACRCYEDLGSHPANARAVGQAVAANPISFLIPCHRVIRKSGLLGNYYWGEEKKLAMLGCETPKTLAANVDKDDATLAENRRARSSDRW